MSYDVKYCSKCGAALPPDAAFCSGCGAPLSSRASAPTVAPPVPSKRSYGCVGLLLGVLTVFVVLAFIGHSVNPPPPALPVDLTAGAERACRAYVLARVKAPKTATFDDKTILGSLLTSGVYMVNGTVDSQNSFGALLRTYWICEVKAPVNGQYDLIRVTFLP